MSDISKSISLVGRPNVGKSRLFNRLVGRRVSIVHDKPGVTRDIVVEKLSSNLILMDTGGMGATAEMTEKVIADATNEQANFAITTADTIIFVVDLQAGLTGLDMEIATLLRSSGKDVVAINKVDLPQHSELASDFYSLGFKNIFEISAEHGTGVDALVSLIEQKYGAIDTEAKNDGEDRIKICVAGRPNVGKSSILNRLLGEKRLIVSDVAGTTRNSVKCDIDVPTKNDETMQFRMYDTAGLRVKRKTNTSLDYLSSLRTRKVISACDVVFLVIDAMEGVSELDKRLAGEIAEAGASIIVVVNKWDYAVEMFSRSTLGNYKNIQEFGKDFENAVRAELPLIGDSRIYFVSAKSNTGVDKLPEAAFRIYNKMNSSVSTGKLNSVIQKLVEQNPPRYISGKRFKVYYSVKVSSRPYTVRMYCNSVQSLTHVYRRYLINGLRDALNLGGVAINLELVGKVSQTNQERLSSKK
ncbi:MAG: ribosome biogenesis GTPase Der [Opitutales bacterium]|nr:ribosome biogenesis GTPase Der [Opitutales bacterium]